MQLNDAETDQDVQMIFGMGEATDLLLSTGFCKPVSNLGVADCVNVGCALLDYHLIGKVKNEIVEFIDVLRTLGLLTAISVGTGQSQVSNKNILEQEATPRKGQTYCVCTL